MLKALELTGFKSFADKTRLEFPDGITVVVGPNGSGKSNIVDGIKWVLGAQSAKALRGKDMADVIFKGSGTNSGRKAANMAEATLVFDNGERKLPVEADEVQITRRVYRSGESEYLINGQPCRLRDIRDLTRGTGVGVDAYSLIEQGKVDRMLQASPKDRRAIFEEAAGISRFKAKKVEAQRRLERVEQNLLRLSDIVEEVESRLRSVRAQASKAQRYREYRDRLQQLRTQVGFTDYRRISSKLAEFEAVMADLRLQEEELTREADLLSAQVEQLEQTVDQADQELRTRESSLSKIHELIAARLSAVETERSRCVDFLEETQRHRQQLRALTGRASDLRSRLHELTQGVAQAESDFDATNQRLRDHEASSQQLGDELERLRGQTESTRKRYVESLRNAAALSNQVESLDADLVESAAVAEKTERELTELDSSAAEQAKQLEESLAEELRLNESTKEKAAELEAADLALAESRRVLARRQEELLILQGKQHGASQRAKVLEQLERQHAGLSSGVQQVLDKLRSQIQAGGDVIHGLVADVLEAGVEIAPMVDIALGDAAQHLVVSGGELIRLIGTGEFQPTGRIGVFQLDRDGHATGLSRSSSASRSQLHGRPGVIGRADQMVHCAEQFRPLIARLLGETWFVERLSDAFPLSRTAGKGLRFVTGKGQLLEANGTLIVGPPQANAGLISRRSELRALQLEIADLQRRVNQFTQEVERLQENIEQKERERQSLADAHRELGESLADHRVRSRTLQDRQVQLQKQRKSLAGRLDAARDKHNSSKERLALLREQLVQAEQTVSDSEASLKVGEQQIDSIEDQVQEQVRLATAAKVDLAKSEERLESLRSQMAQLETDRRERSRAIAEVREQLDQALRRREQADLHVLRGTSELAELYLRKEALAAEVAGALENRRRRNSERASITAQQDKIRRAVRKLEEEQHRQQLEARELQLERNSLAERLQDDYGIDIASVTEEETPEEEQQRAEVEAEIEDLRTKLNRIGAVNVDSLEELDDLDERYQKLHGQFQDLTQAKESLERIIQKINSDSRRLFMDTLEAIRANFQVLYRKAFGGGRADIVLEEGKDVLECGIDILATPPGKPSFSNSLLSGGEKALTAVSLLLAIFQFRPSPFCILDEVDAPFDEANIGRFVDVLKDFLDWTKFVIVTHSKKTMTAATTLYGVTMQESGVSKRVSVRFEDVSDDGEISDDAVHRDEPGEQAA